MIHVPAGHKQPAVLNVLTANERYLLLHRDREPNRGKYTPVGGKMDAYESPIEAVFRETREETGLEIQDPVFCGVLVDNSPTIYNWICFIYRTIVAEHIPASCDEGTLEWIREDEVETIPTPVTDQYICSYIRSGQPFMINALYDRDLRLLQLDEQITGETIFRASI